MGRMTWNGLVVGMLGVVALTGCPTSPPCSDITLTIDSPAEGATVDAGFPVKASARYASDGTAAPFDTFTVTVADGGTFSGVPDVSGGATGTVAVGPLPPGSKSLVATATRGQCGPDATDSANRIAPSAARHVTVKPSCTPSALAVTFPQDLPPAGNGNNILNAAELPLGTDLDIKVTGTCTGGYQVRLRAGADGGILGPVDLSSGAATLTRPVDASFDGTISYIAELVAPGGTVLTSPTTTAAIDIHRTAPACTLSPIARQGPSTDADTNTAQHQMTVSFAIGGNGSSGSLTSTIPGSTPKAVAGTDTTAVLTAPASGDTTYTVTLTCTDSNGNTATANTDARVDYQAPAIAITDPTLLADGGAVVVTTSPLTLAGTTDADAVQECAFRYTGSTPTSLGCHALSATSFTDQVAFPLDGAYDIELKVTDSVGNVGSLRFPVSVTLAGCGLGFLKPAACPALVTAAQVNNGIYGFQTQSKITCQGQPVTLTRADALPDAGFTAPVQVGTGNVNASGVTNIGVTVASGSYQFNASVVNVGVDAGTTSVSCPVTVDLDGPVIQVPVANAVINAAQDSSASTPGAQRLLQFSARIPLGGRADLCTTQAVDPVTSITRPTSTECGGGYYVLQTGVTSPTAGFTFPEGRYSLKLVVSASGVVSSSAAVPIFVDVTRPCVLAGSVSYPQDGNADHRLNLAELAGQPPRLRFQLDPSCGDSDLSTLAASNPVVVEDVVAGSPPTLSGTAYNQSTDVSLASGTFTVVLSRNVAAEKDYVFFVQLTDAAGNTNQLAVSNDPASAPVRVDTVAPTCTITSPAAGQTLFGLAQVPANQFGVTVATSADVGTNGVSVGFTGSSAHQATPDAQTNVATTAFSVTGTATYDVTATCTDQSGNPTTATARTGVTIDLDPPTCAIVLPTQANQPTDTLTTQLNVGGAEGRPVNCTANGSPLAPALTVSGGVASGTYIYPTGAVSLVCTVADSAGNSCTAPASGTYGFNVTSQGGFHIAFAAPVASNANGNWYNQSNVTGISGSTATATVNLHSTDSGPGVTVRLTNGTLTLTGTTDLNGNVTFSNVTLTEGETWTATIVDGVANRTDTFRVAFTAPTITGVTVKGTAVANGANVFIVAPQDNENVRNAVAGYFTSGDAASGVVAYVVTGVTGARKFNLDGTLDVLLGGAVVAGGSSAISGSPQDITFASLTLPQNSAAALAVRLTDAAGNQTTVQSNPVQVDVIPPAAPTVTQGVTDARAATVNLQWAPTYDDGSTLASGATAGYDVRWTTAAVPNNLALATTAAYFSSAAFKETASPWSASPISRNLTLPPLNTYYLAVRALDEVGNYSAYSAPVALQNWWTPVVLTGPGSSTFGQSVLVSPSLNNDALADIVVSAPTRTGGGAVYVYYGAANLADQPTCGAGCQLLTPSDATAGQFGSDISAGGNIGDVGAEGKPDLVVAQSWTGAAPNNGGRVVLFFGTATGATLGTDTASSIELRGDSTNRIGATARIIPDLDGDGLAEVALAMPFFNAGLANQGRVLIYKGRTFAQWSAARTATDATSLVPYIPVSAATASWVIDGPSPLLVSPAGNAFGQNRWGLVSVGDLNADGVTDIAIPMSRASINRYRVFSGAAITASSAATPLSAGTFLLELTQATVADNAVTNGLGASSIGNLDVVGATSVDLVTAFPGAAGGGKVYVYADPVSGAAPSPFATVTGPLTFGYQVAVGRVNGDVRQDLLVGQGGTTANLSWVVYQQTGATTFDTGLGTGTDFWVSKFDPAVILGVASPPSSLGKSNGLGDVDGNGQADVVLSDDTRGEIRIWR